MEVLDIALKYASVALLGLLGVFVFFGMVYGMVRGFKRSLLRLVLYVGLLVAVFLLTPIVTNAILGININFFGRTLRGWIDFIGGELVVFLKKQFGEYVAPFGSYLNDLAVGLVLAVVNLIIFFAMYFIMKFVSWIIYSIVAHFWAPKTDRNGKKYPKHVWGGLLIGALQGVALFLFFMLPINGLLGVVHQAVQYQAVTVETVQAQAVAADGQSNDGKFDLEKLMVDVDDSLSLYNNVMKYSGLQFLSNKAFEYQLTVRIEDMGSVNLVHDINSVWELYVDAKALGPVFDKLVDMFEKQDYTLLNAKEYQLLRNATNKVFDLQLLKIADWFLADLDEILSTPFDEEDQSYLTGTQIYKNSIYGVLAEQCATEREVVADANNYNKFTDAIRGVVNFVAEQKMDLVRNDVLNVIDLFEALNTYKVRFNGEIKTVAAVMSQDGLDWRDYLNLATARLVVATKDYGIGTPIMDILGADLKDFALVKMLGLTDMENLIIYSNFFDESLADFVEMQDLVYGMAGLLLGDKAYTKGEVQGSWAKLGDAVFDLADALNQNSEVVDDLIAMFGNEEMDAQSMIGTIGKLMISKEYYDAHLDEFNGKTYEAVKFQKVDALLDSIYDAVNVFAPVKEFLTARLTNMNEDDNELLNMLTELMTAERQVWHDKFHGLVSAANLMNNQVVSDLMDKLGGGEGEITAEDIAQVFDVINNEMDGEMVSEIIDTVVNLPEVGETMKENVTEALDKINEEKLTEMFEDSADVAKAQASLDTLKEYLNKETTTAEDKQELADAMNDFLSLVDGEKFKDFISGLNP